METNIVIKSKDRDLFGVVIKQEPQTGFLSVSELQKAYEIARMQYGWGESCLASLMQAKDFKIQLFNELTSRGLLQIDLFEFNKTVSDIGITKFLKRHNLWITKGARASKQAYCEEVIFKMITIRLFGSFYYSIEPEWLQLIGVNITNTLKRAESFENNFISIIIDKIGFLADSVQKQFRLKNYIYDLCIDIFDKRILIEYHEEQHNGSYNLQNDKDKYNTAVNNGYFYVVIPIGSESLELKFIKDILSNKEDIDSVNEISYYRFNTDVDLKYSIAINERVFGKHMTGIRNLATSSEMQKITKLEQFINGSIKTGFATTDEQILHGIKTCQL
jgi:hypothetical protein